LIARYSEPQSLSGFFWSLGGGYRQYNAEWKKKPEDADKEPRMSMTDDDGYLHHRVVGSGVVGVARVGYRFIPAEWPIALGAHIGMRHMNSTVKDVEVDDDEQEKLNLEYSKINEKERKSIKNRMMTQPDFAIEFGFSF